MVKLYVLMVAPMVTNAIIPVFLDSDLNMEINRESVYTIKLIQAKNLYVQVRIPLKLFIGVHQVYNNNTENSRCYIIIIKFDA